MNSSKLYELYDKDGHELVLVEEVELDVPASGGVVHTFEKPFKSALVLVGREFAVDVTTVAKEHDVDVTEVRDLTNGSMMLVCLENSSSSPKVARIYVRWKFEPVKEFLRKVCRKESTE